MKYRKKPVIIEAIQWNGDNTEELEQFMPKEVYEFCLKGFSSIYSPSDCELYIITLEGKMKANIGDYIIKGVNGEYYPCKPDIFEKTYEKVE